MLCGFTSLQALLTTTALIKATFRPALSLGHWGSLESTWLRNWCEGIGLGLFSQEVNWVRKTVVRKSESILGWF